LIKHVYVIAIKHGHIRRDANPAELIRKFPEASRDRFLKSDEMKRFFDALTVEDNPVFKNYILLSLFTGQRRNNVLTMRWDNIDLKNVLFTFLTPRMANRRKFP
jgi:integrase